VPENFVVKDSGVRQEYTTGMKRDTQEGKPRYDLIIPDNGNTMLTRWAIHMAKGAVKYSQPIPMTSQLLFSDVCGIIGIWKQSNARIKIDLYTALALVGRVTKNTYAKITLSSGSANSKTELLGEKEIKSQSGWLHKNVEQTQIFAKEIVEQRGGLFYEIEDSQKKQQKFYLNGREVDAEYVDESLKNSLCILTITVKLDSREDIYVLGATTASECLGMMYKDLSEHCHTSKIIQQRELLLDNGVVTIRNERNWELARTVEEAIRFRASACRHFFQWMFGERDEDHAAAVFFNIQAAEYVRERILHENKERDSGG